MVDGSSVVGGGTGVPLFGAVEVSVDVVVGFSAVVVVDAGIGGTVWLVVRIIVVGEFVVGTVVVVVAVAVVVVVVIVAGVVWGLRVTVRAWVCV